MAHPLQEVWILGSSPRKTPDLGTGFHPKRHSPEAIKTFSAPPNGKVQLGGAKQTVAEQIRY
jgi:hypothetical protein